MINKPLTRRVKKRKLKKIIKNVMANRLQKAYRKYFNRMIDKDERSMKDDDYEYRNDSTLTCIELDYMDKRYFYKNNGYFFDIRELETSKKHPYTNKDFTLEDKRQIKRILYFLKSRYYSYRELNEEDYELNLQERYTAYKTDVIKKIESEGVYLPINVFNSYSIVEIFYFSIILLNWRLIKSIPDIDNYRKIIIYNYKKYTYYYNLSDVPQLYFNQVKLDFKYSVIRFLDYITSIDDDNKISRCLIVKNTMIPIDIIPIDQ